jgi:hypothetical protein
MQIRKKLQDIEINTNVANYLFKLCVCNVLMPLEETINPPTPPFYATKNTKFPDSVIKTVVVLKTLV